MTKTMVYMMGAPAAGKTTVSRRMYADATFVDADEIAMRMPEYEAEHPERVHEAAMEIYEKVLEDVTRMNNEGLVVVDGTGYNVERMTERMTRSKECGWKVELTYVVCPLEVSIQRNKTRGRTLPEDVVVRKYHMVKESFKAISPLADEVRVVETA